MFWACGLHATRIRRLGKWRRKLDTFIHWLIPFVAGGTVTTLGVGWKRLRAIEAGLRQLLRSRLVEIHREYVVEGKPIRLDIKDDADRTYAAYHELGGNGTGSAIYDDIMHLDITSEPRA